ncbi:AMP-binding enzyme [Reichenbachiella faecimaris]|uniref:AMP-binding enzyme n=1 Tax=Reichenbachiella faecimaris TaxID=692418 RepID=A0A1W2GC88_REIFA|nr:AMP-binding protein [Reichenbachiella faecimaris]SMD34134.1 AMP-binding enzyme [Reichenbachiella faecimaris]
MNEKLDIDNLPTLTEMLYYWEREKPEGIFLKQPFGNQWINFSWAESVGQIRRMANYLSELHLPPLSKIALVSKNCAHWILADQAITMAGHVVVPIYPTLTAPQLNEILVHSDSQIIFTGKLDDWEGMKEGVPSDMKGIALPLSSEKNYANWDEIIENTSPITDDPVPNPEHLVAILYTSGTTGTPKGVMLKHKNYQLAGRAIEKVIEVISKPHVLFSYLPLCHVGERMAVESTSIYSGGTISFVESIDTFAQNLQDTRPTIFFGVPRIWSKFQLGVLEKLPQNKLNLLLKIPFLGNFIKNKIKKGLGLDRAEIVITTAAPCPKALLDWYDKIDIPLLELYGMTENHGVCTIMPVEKTKIGSVGKAYPDAELMIDKETGEIKMKADWMMAGYYKEPNLTAQVLANGYLHTGDIGELDEEGYLFITGRLKDTFKTAKGKFVVPGPIEWGFALNNDVEQICVLGRNLPQPIALVVLSEIGMRKSPEQLLTSLTNTIGDIVEDLVSYEKLKKAIIVQEPWSVENGTLTPTMKIKRNILEKRYVNKLEAWYNQPETVIWEQIPIV